MIAKLSGATDHRFGHQFLEDWTEISSIANGAKQDFRLQDGTLKLKVELTPDASKRGEAAGVLRFDQENSPVPAGYTFAAPILWDVGK